MEKSKVKDFLCASRDEVVNSVVESDMLPTAVEEIADVVVSEGIAEIVGTLIGAFAPRINGMRLSYKQNRFETRVESALTLMAKRIETMEANYVALTEEVQEKFRGQYVEWLLDNLEVEKQPEKVPYHVNGFINLMSNEANDNLMLMFFDTINQLTQLDIDVLSLYSRDTQEKTIDLCDRYNLKMEQVTVIREKLERLGLVYSKNDEQRDNNIDEIVDYLNKVDRDQKKR
ncbi:MAG: hypothetical protein ACI4TG_07345, partial [Ruminococcus sp.]